MKKEEILARLIAFAWYTMWVGMLAAGIYTSMQH